MQYQRITEATAPLYIGAKVKFNYGPMCGSEKGWVVGQRSTRWGTNLIAMTDKGECRSIEGFSDIGVGVYLLEMGSATA